MNYEGKVRVRVCGLLVEDDQILLLKHEGLGPAGHLWLPPGGGLEFNETAEERLVQEFLEETNLTIEVQDFLFISEHRDAVHHAIELFFRVKRISGETSLGVDPEVNEQILSEIAFFSHKDLTELPQNSFHSSFNKIESLEDLFELRGYYKFVRM